MKKKLVYLDLILKQSGDLWNTKKLKNTNLYDVERKKIISINLE